MPEPSSSDPDLDARLGTPVPGWTPPPRPGPAVLEGRWARLERLDPARHGPEVHAANRGSDALWDFMPYGPFAEEAEWRAWADGMAPLADPFFYAVRDRGTGRAAGVRWSEGLRLMCPTSIEPIAGSMRRKLATPAARPLRRSRIA